MMGSQSSAYTNILQSCNCDLNAWHLAYTYSHLQNANNNMIVICKLFHWHLQKVNGGNRQGTLQIVVDISHYLCTFPHLLCLLCTSLYPHTPPPTFTISPLHIFSNPCSLVHLGTPSLSLGDPALHYCALCPILCLSYTIMHSHKLPELCCAFLASPPTPSCPPPSCRQ